MTKNEIVARWIDVTNPNWIGIFSYEVFHEAWVKFRDLKLDGYETQRLHIKQTNLIRELITDGTITEAFDELAKGIIWYNSLNSENNKDLLN